MPPLNKDSIFKSGNYTEQDPVLSTNYLKRAFNFRKLAFKAPKVFDPVSQLNKTPLKDFMSHSEEALNSEYVLLTGHPGFVDAELLGLTTLSLERVRDHEMDTSSELKKWIEDNGVELITYSDLN